MADTEGHAGQKDRANNLRARPAALHLSRKQPVHDVLARISPPHVSIDRNRGGTIIDRQATSHSVHIRRWRELQPHSFRLHELLYCLLHVGLLANWRVLMAKVNEQENMACARPAPGSPQTCTVLSSRGAGMLVDCENTAVSSCRRLMLTDGSEDTETGA